VFETTRRHIFLAGFMGTGKTSIGAHVARQLGWGFIDLDQMIEMSCRRSIPEIFRVEGEHAFRLHEARVLRLAVIAPHSVIALGGGTPMMPASANIIRATGRCWLLEASWHVIWERVKENMGARPLLAELLKSPAVGDTRYQRFLEIVRPIAEQRASVYANIADHRLDTSESCVESLAEIIVAQFRTDATIGE
jgi:shikimate kinase